MAIKQAFFYFIKLPTQGKFWFLFSIASSFYVFLVIKLAKPKHLHGYMGKPAGNTMLCLFATQEQELKAWRIARVVKTACQAVPWECKCLSEAICTNILLKRYAIPSVFYLGSKIDHATEQTMKAHAWLQVGKYSIIGGDIANDNYIVSATFTRPALKN